MKKEKRFNKSQVALGVMVVALAVAVWLNMRYSTDVVGEVNNTSSKYLGQAEFVNGNSSSESLQVSAKPATEEETYFINLRKERQNSRNDALGTLEEVMAKENLSTEEKKTAADKMAQLALRSEKEAAIETLLKAKGFSSVLAVIGDKDINIIVKSDGLLPSETVQIQDAALTQTDFAMADIKIIAMNDNEIKNALK
ncbi:MAG: SpoIIIAH-like family protein [Clostridia bacterium]|nr:SpoIIIAH-like family protein [Clostridia bacterium]